MIRALVMAAGPELEAMESWLSYLRDTKEVETRVIGSPEELADLARADVVVAHDPSGALGGAAEEGIADFLTSGGGLVSLHCTSANWSRGPRLGPLIGGAADRLPAGELVVDVERSDHDITRRSPTSFTVLDSGFTVEDQGANGAEAEVLLSTTWRSGRRPLATVRRAGSGRVVHFGLGGAASTFQSPSVQDLLYRGVRHAAGRSEGSPVGVGLVGFGAIGPEHLSAISAVPGLSVAAVADHSPERLKAAIALAPEAAPADGLDELLDNPAVGAVVVSTPPNTHFALARRALEAGRHVIVEKPFCLTVAEADQLLEAATGAQRTLTVYQSRRWDPDFMALRELVETGQLGRVFHLEAFVGGFEHPCHFWHSDSSVSGGVIFDWGAHYLDWILQLLPGRVVEVSASSQKLIWLDVTNEDHFVLRMTFEDGASAEFIHSDIAAARKPKWYLLGTEGAAVGLWREESRLVATPTGVSEVPVPVADLPCELHLLRPGPAGRSHDQRVALPMAPPQAFYRNLAGHLLAREPLAVTPEAARRNIAIMEAAMRAASAGPQRVRI